MTTQNKLRVLIAAPLPPPDHGGICNWSRIVKTYFGEDSPFDLQFLDTTVRLREATSVGMLSRFFTGAFQASWNICQLLFIFLHKRPHLFHLCTSGGLATNKDIQMLRLARWFGIPCVIHYHMGRIPQIFAKKGLDWKLTRRAMQMADAVVTLDRHSEKIVRLDLPNVRVLTLPNFVEVSELDKVYDLAKRDVSKAGPHRIVYVGQLLPTKGIVELVQACARQEEKNFILELVGPISASFQKELRALVASNGKPEWLRFVGSVSHEEAMKYLARADTFVLPSYTEGAPNVILEAMALKRSIIATPVGAIPEMLDFGGPEECGVCVPPQDVQSLTHAIAATLKKGTSSDQNNDIAYARAKRYYDVPVACEQLANMWRGLADPAQTDILFPRNPRQTVLLVAPLPPPEHGGIANWSRIVRRTLADSPRWLTLFVDSYARYRKATNQSFLVRLFGGSLHACKTLLAVYQSIRRLHPRIIHICTSGGLATPRNIITLRMAKYFGVKSLIHYRMGAIPRAFKKQGVEWRWLQRAMNLADVVVTLDHQSEDCVRAGLPSKRVITLPNMVEVDVLDAICNSMEKQPVPKKNELHVVFVGHVLPAKGVAEFVEACVQFAKRNNEIILGSEASPPSEKPGEKPGELPESHDRNLAPETKNRFIVDIVGPVSTTFHEKLVQLAAESGVEGWLRFHGTQLHDDAVRFMVNSDLVVLPSYSEGFPNVILEAMALGKAILATTVGAVPEMLDIGGAEECGILVPPREIPPLSEALERLVRDADLRRRLGEKARQRAERLYAVPVASKQLTDLWESLLEENSGSKQPEESSATQGRPVT